MTTVRQVLQQKSPDVCIIGPDETVFEALTLMAASDIGSLLVMADGKLLGIVTERHYSRKVVLKGKTSPATAVKDIMEKSVICVRPEQSVEECMALMNAKRVRHLPVLDGDKVIGIVSIGDLVKSIIGDQKFVIEQLVHYVHG
jgi:CBS domain-containing protein